MWFRGWCLSQWPSGPVAQWPVSSFALSGRIALAPCLLGFLDHIGRTALCHIELFRLAAGDTQCLPLRSGVMFGEEHDLPDMRRVVRGLTIDRFEHGMSFATDVDRLREISRRQCSHGVEQTLPAIFPLRCKRRACVRGTGFEFSVAIPIRLLPVAGQKIGPPRSHVARHVLHDHREAVCLGVQDGKEMLVRGLRQSLVGLTFQLAQLPKRIVEIMLLDQDKSILAASWRLSTGQLETGNWKLETGNWKLTIFSKTKPRPKIQPRA